MRTYFFKIILCLSFVMSGCSKKDDTWDTIAVGLPDKLDPSVSMLNMGYYLLKQTHQTILHKNSKGLYDSKFLTSWKRSLDNRNFSFCLKNPVKFDDKKLYTANLLFSDLKKIA